MDYNKIDFWIINFKINLKEDLKVKLINLLI
jgi:hypothetical protein